MLELVFAILIQEPAKPGPHHEHLKAFVGTWDAVVKMGDNESKGVETCTLTMGGLWLVQDFESEFMGAPFRGHGVSGYDSAKKKYVGVWTDSMTDALMISEGTCDGSGKTFTHESQFQGDKFKEVAEIQDKDHRTFKMYKGDELVMTISYVRRSFTIPKTVAGKDGWDDYVEPLVVAKDATPGADSPEAATVHFYASLLRGDKKHEEVLPAERSESLKRKMAEILSWKFLEVKLLGRQKKGEDTVYVKVYLKIRFGNKEDEGTDDVELRRSGGKWVVVRPPS
jgi:hypothetical protein